MPFSLSFAIEAGSGSIRRDEKYGMFWGERKKNDTSGGSYYYEKRKETDSRSGDCAGDCRCGEIPESLEESAGLHFIGASVIAMFIGMIVNAFTSRTA